MKKIFFKIIITGIFVIVIAMNLLTIQGSKDHDVTLVMKNIEALADGEDPGSCKPPYNQYNYNVYKYYQSGKCYINCWTPGSLRCCLDDHCP